MCSYKKCVQKNNAQLITWSFLMIQSLSFTSAAFEVFAGAYLCFLVSASAKKMPRIKFLGTSKNMSPRIKYIFVWKKKAMFRTSRIFSWFHNADHLLYYSQMSVFSFHTSFVLLYQFLRNRRYNWQKFNNKMNEKKKPGLWAPWICNQEN